MKQAYILSHLKIPNNVCLFTPPTILGIYAAAIQVEDFTPSLVGSPSVPLIAHSSVPLQFLITVKESSSTCDVAPAIVGELHVDACLVRVE